MLVWSKNHAAYRDRCQGAIDRLGVPLFTSRDLQRAPLVCCVAVDKHSIYIITRMVYVCIALWYIDYGLHGHIARNICTLTMADDSALPSW